MAAEEMEVGSQLSEAGWISSNIKMRRCKTYAPPDPNGACQCGMSKELHDEFARNNQLPANVQWAQDLHMESSPTTAFGEIEFPRYRTSKYVRIDSKTPIDTVAELLFNKRAWGLKKPGLVLSVTGGAQNFDLAENEMTRFQRGIARVAQSTRAWVISGGTFVGVMKHVGKAMRTFADPSANQVVCLGIAPWGVIANRESLIAMDGEQGRYPAVYNIPKSHKKDKKTYLDRNGHTHFLLVDDGSVGTFGREIAMRSAVEEYLSKALVGDSLGVSTPSCMVVLQGGPGTLETVAGGLSKDTAVVVIRNSGMIANVIVDVCDALDAAYKAEAPAEAGAEQKPKYEMTPEFEERIRKLLLDMNPNMKPEVLTKCIGHMKICVAKRDLITVYSATGSIDLEAAILLALLKTSDEIRNQLSLAIVWNRIDIARKHIFKAKALKKIDRKVLEELCHYAIQHNRNHFIEIFVENGLNFKTFVTPRRMFQLYNTLPAKAHHLRSLIEMKHSNVAENHGNETPRGVGISLYQIGQLIDDSLLRDAMGHRYKGDKRLSMIDNKDGEPVSEQSSSAEYAEDDGTVHSQYYVPGQTVSALRQNGSGSLTSENRIQWPYDPVFDLFEYSVLLNRREQSLLFFEHVQDGLIAAVYAIRLLKQLAAKAEIGEEREEYMETANEYEKIATDILKRCFEGDRAHTRTLLIRESRQVSNRTVIQLANEAQALKILAHYAVKSLTDELWMGYIRGQATRRTLGLVAAAIIVPPLLFIFNYAGETTQTDKPEAITGPSSGSGARAGERKMLAHERLPPPTFANKIAYFYNAPITVYLHVFMSFCIFLILLSTETLLFFGSGWNQEWLEILLIIWVGSYFCEEIRHALMYGTGGVGHRLSTQLIRGWSLMQLFAILFFYLGVILTFVPDATPASISAGRIFEAISLMLFFFRMYKYYAIDRKLGPQVLMMSRMLHDLAVWTAVIGVIIVSWGVAQYSLLFPQSGDMGWVLIRDVLVMPFWQMFSSSYFSVSGQYPYDNVDEASSCTTNSSLYTTYNGIRCADNTGQWLVPIILGVYVVLTVLLMFNILIAMFVYTVEAINEETEEYYQFQRFELISELNLTPPLVPPLVLLCHIYLIFKALVAKCRGVPYARDEVCKPTYVLLDSRDDRYILTWLKGYKDEYCKSQKIDDAEKLERLTKRLHKNVNKTHVQVLTAAAVAKCNVDRSNGEAGGERRKVITETDLKLEQERVHDRLTNTNGMLRTMLTVLSRTAAMQQASEIEQTRQAVAPVERRSIFKVHTECRNQNYPGTNQHRVTVPDNKVDWNAVWPKYEPPLYTENSVSENYTIVDQEQADGSPLQLPFNQYDVKMSVNRMSTGSWYLVDQGWPLNPSGRTGLRGRGTLPLWGPNHSMCCAFTRPKTRASKKVVAGRPRKRKPYEIDDTPVFEILVIYDQASQRWTVPIGIFGSTQNSPSDMIQKSLEGLIQDSDLNEHAKEEKLQNLQTLFQRKGNMMRLGYFDSPMNTDNSWIEASCLAFHDSEGCTADIESLDNLGVEAKWFDLHSDVLMHGGQLAILRQIAEQHRVHYPLETFTARV